MKSKKNEKGETSKILTICKLHWEVTGFDPILSGFSSWRLNLFKHTLQIYHMTILSKMHFEEIAP